MKAGRSCRTHATAALGAHTLGAAILAVAGVQLARDRLPRLDRERPAQRLPLWGEGDRDAGRLLSRVQHDDRGKRLRPFFRVELGQPRLGFSLVRGRKPHRGQQRTLHRGWRHNGLTHRVDEVRLGM